ncbi:MAG: hypothetical protein IPM53_20760 [Anaerolineaceae bacterium]|nr:hypothetical protein [Anaerolineaceae bacterium]
MLKNLLYLGLTGAVFAIGFSSWRSPTPLFIGDVLLIVTSVLIVSLLELVISMRLGQENLFFSTSLAGFTTIAFFLGVLVTGQFTLNELGLYALMGFILGIGVGYISLSLHIPTLLWPFSFILVTFAVVLERQEIFQANPFLIWQLTILVMVPLFILALFAPIEEIASAGRLSIFSLILTSIWIQPIILANNMNESATLFRMVCLSSFLALVSLPAIMWARNWQADQLWLEPKVAAWSADIKRNRFMHHLSQFLSQPDVKKLPNLNLRYLNASFRNSSILQGQVSLNTLNGWQVIIANQNLPLGQHSLTMLTRVAKESDNALKKGVISLLQSMMTQAPVATVPTYLNQLMLIDKRAGFEPCKILFERGNVDPMFHYLQEAIRNDYQEGVEFLVYFSRKAKPSSQREIVIWLQEQVLKRNPVDGAAALTAVSRIDDAAVEPLLKASIQVATWSTAIFAKDPALLEAIRQILVKEENKERKNQLAFLVKVGQMLNQNLETEQVDNGLPLLLANTVYHSVSQVSQEVAETLVQITSNQASTLLVQVAERNQISKLENMLKSSIPRVQETGYDTLRQLYMDRPEWRPEIIEIERLVFRSGTSGQRRQALAHLANFDNALIIPEVEWAVNQSSPKYVNSILELKDEHAFTVAMAVLVGYGRHQAEKSEQLWIQLEATCPREPDTLAAISLIALALFNPELLATKFKTSRTQWSSTGLRLAMAQPDSPLLPIMEAWLLGHNVEHSVQCVYLLEHVLALNEKEI